MTAPAPRPDGKPRLHVYKVGAQWRVSVGHNPLTLHAEKNQKAAFGWALRQSH